MSLNIQVVTTENLSFKTTPRVTATAFYSMPPPVAIHVLRSEPLFSSNELFPLTLKRPSSVPVFPHP